MEEKMYSSAQSLIGILVTDALITRSPGDVGNPATYPFPVLNQKVPNASQPPILPRSNTPNIPITTFIGNLTASVRLLNFKRTKKI
jgi:hypothetical protein